jgi:hypothetical protein
MNKKDKKTKYTKKSEYTRRNPSFLWSIDITHILCERIPKPYNRNNKKGEEVKVNHTDTFEGKEWQIKSPNRKKK